MSLSPHTTGLKISILLIFVFVIGNAIYYRVKSINEPLVFDFGQILPNAVSLQVPDVSLVSSSTTATSTPNVTKGAYEVYSKGKINVAEEGVRVILFFNASWSLSCQTADREFLDSTIPDNVLILSVDFDSYLTLRKEYEVSREHTFVEVDGEGKVIQKWEGGGLARVIEAL